jgi:hypothetical protein
MELMTVGWILWTLSVIFFIVLNIYTFVSNLKSNMSASDSLLGLTGIWLLMSYVVFVPTTAISLVLAFFINKDILIHILIPSFLIIGYIVCTVMIHKH